MAVFGVESKTLTFAKGNLMSRDGLSVSLGGTVVKNIGAPAQNGEPFTIFMAPGGDHVFETPKTWERVSERNPHCSCVRCPHKRLLVVDDDEDIILMLEDRLEMMGYGVLRATNGVEALDVLGRIPVDGVLLDIEMPVLDGLMLLRELQEQYMHVPVIVMSAGSDPQKFAQAIELGAMDYLKKPIDTLLLIEKCERLFG